MVLSVLQLPSLIQQHSLRFKENSTTVHMLNTFFNILYHSQRRIIFISLPLYEAAMCNVTLPTALCSLCIQLQLSGSVVQEVRRIFQKQG